MAPIAGSRTMNDAKARRRDLAGNRIWCVDSPGWGGSEMDLCRVWRLLGIEREHVLLNPEASAELRSECERRRHLCISGFAANDARNAIPSLIRAGRWIASHPRGRFIVWSHHSDSNRWLQFMLAITRRDFIVVERLVPSSRADLARSRLTVPIKRLVSRRARAMVLCGESQRTHYRDLFEIPDAPIKVIVVTRPIRRITERVEELRADSGKLRQDLGIRNAPTVVCVARLCAQKDQATLIRAAAKAARSLPTLQLLLVGDGPDRKALEELALSLLPNQVVFAGHQADPVLWLAGADLFVLPSLCEGLPGVLIEAMAARLPCIATDIPGNRELIRHGQTGLTCQTSDDTSLAEHIVSLLTNRALAENYADAGLQLVQAGYDESQEQAAWNALIGNDATGAVV